MSHVLSKVRADWRRGRALKQLKLGERQYWEWDSKTDAGLDLGMICSLSIPIITIVALILLFIFVILFDIIFSWIPFFFFCFPVPKFSAKPPEAPALPLP